MLKKALELASKSSCDQFRHSAVIMGKGNRFITGACNITKKTHPNGSGPFSATHAECRAIAKAKAILNTNNLKGYKILCVRMNTQGFMKLSKPCPDCRRHIDECGLRAIWSTGHGLEYDQR